MSAYPHTEKGGGWRARLAPYGKLLARWGWFIILSMALVTFCTSRLPDPPAIESYESTLQIQVTGTNGVSTTITFFSQLLVSPGTLNLAMPKLSKLSQFQGLQLSDLQTVVTATPVVTTNIVLLNAVSDTPKDATTIVNAVYQAFLDEIHVKRSTVVTRLDQLLQIDLNQTESDIANSTTQLQYLKDTNQESTSQFHQLTVLYHAQQERANAINALLTPSMLNPDSMLTLANSTPGITTIPATAPTISQRLALSPLVGLFMGIGGAMLASRFSNSVPLRGKKREKVLPHIMATVPFLPDVRKNRLQALERASSHGLLLLRRLRHQSTERENTLQVVTVTGPKGYEGKSTVATLLAVAAAQSGLKTVLVDMNLQRPVLHTWFQCANGTGMLGSIRSFAMGSPGSSPIAATSVAGLGLIPVGNADQRGSSDKLEDVLQVDGLSAFIQVLRKQADLVIFDCPSLLNNPGSVNPAALADAVLLVVDAKRSRSSQILEAEALLSRIGVSFFLLLNRVKSEAVE